MEVNEVEVARFMVAGGSLVDAYVSSRAGVSSAEPIRWRWGWPSSGGKGKKSRVLGEAWQAGASADGVKETFVSPTLADAFKILETMVHEQIHHALPPAAKHGKEFRRVMALVGLEGKPTATVAGADLAARIGDWVAELGPFPAGALTPADPKQKCRQGLCVCPACGFKARISKVWRESIGLPKCECDGVTRWQYVDPESGVDVGEEEEAA